MAISSPHASLLLLVASALSACVSIAPPVRTGHYGAPARVEAGMVEVAGEVAYGPDLAGGPVFGYGISDLVAVEGGVEIGQQTRVIGWAGARLTPLRPRQRDFAFVLDVEGGAGAGVGGRLCNQSACESTIQDLHRPAGGGYLGLGIGGKIKWFSPWLRLRTQASAAEGVPITSLTTAMLGVQFSIARLVHVFAGTGCFLLANENLTYFGWFPIDGGLSFTIPTPRSRRLAAERRAKQAR